MFLLFEETIKMIYEHINLKTFYPELPNDVYLTAMCLSNNGEYPYNRYRPAVIVLPGGGYSFCSDREAEPVAIKLMANDINCFVLKYTIGEFKYPLPFIEVLAAIDYVRNHAEQYHIIQEKIGVMGFSAGGHLAACIGHYYKDNDFLSAINLDGNNVKPNFVVLGYPVIDLKDEREDSSTSSKITQGRLDLLDKLNIYEKVDNNYPPTFIWTTKTDSIVPCRHSLIFKEQLDKFAIINEFHLYEDGEHGGSTCDDMVCTPEQCTKLGNAKEWIALASNFIKYKI